jgi:hypothetical protein
MRNPSYAIGPSYAHKAQSGGVGPGEEIVDTVVRMSVDDFRDDVDQVDVWINADVGSG